MDYVACFGDQDDEPVTVGDGVAGLCGRIREVE